MPIKKPIMTYLGPPGSFSEITFRKFFKDKYNGKPVGTYEELFESTVKGKSDVCLVPFENSQEGAVKSNVNMLMKHGLKINQEVYLPLSQNLLSKETDFKKIAKIYSHLQALLQCDAWIKTNLPKAKVIETTSTSEAAKLVQKEKNTAAIGSARAAEIFDLNILARNLSQNPTNTTRFLVLEKDIQIKKTDNKFFVYVVVSDKVGALLELLQIFAKHDINLTEIESRPHKEKLWNYGFFIGAIGNLKNPATQAALKELGKNCTRYEILGSLNEPKFSEDDLSYFYQNILKIFDSNRNLLSFRKQTKTKEAEQVFEFLLTRFSIVCSIAIIKKHDHVKISDKEREKTVFDQRLDRYNVTKSLEDKLVTFFGKIMDISKELQQTVQKSTIITKKIPKQLVSYSLDELRSFIDIIDHNIDNKLSKFSNQELEKILSELLLILKNSEITLKNK